MEILKVIEALETHCTDERGLVKDDGLSTAMAAAAALLVGQGEKIADLESKVAELETQNRWIPVKVAYVKTMTNADRIRAMSNEELAVFIHEPFCDKRTHEECTISYCGVCNQCALDWLQQPAEEAPNAEM